MKKLDTILLIDDDFATNVANEMIISRLQCCEQIIIKQSGQLALDYLICDTDQVDLILLDINMPGMNGWEFLEKYNGLPASQKARAVVVMLTSSLNPTDREIAGNVGVKKFMSKPLSLDMMRSLLQEKFDFKF